MRNALVFTMRPLFLQSQCYTMTQTLGTEPGMVMGTAGYMSPEQMRGHAVDHRTDIFAFGAVLYEMLAGKRAFQRPTPVETMSAILNDEPPAMSQTQASLPPGLQRVVNRCLEKNPEQRFHSVTEALVLIFPTIYAMSGGLLLQWLLHYNFSVAVAVGYIALFGIAVETGVVMVVYLDEALDHKLQLRKTLTNADVEAAAIEGAAHRLRPKLMTVCAVLASLVPILWESGIGSDVMKPIAAPSWRHDYLHHSRPDTGARLLRDDERTGIAEGHLQTRNQDSGISD